MKFAINGDQWLDPGTVKLFFTITNNDATKWLQPYIAGAWGFFRRVRVLCGGQIVEDIDDYNRLHEMFHLMLPSDRCHNDNIEGLGAYKLGAYTLDRDNIGDAIALTGGQSKVVCFTPFVGILRQDKFLPIRYAPLQFEFEVVANAREVVYGMGGTAGPPDNRSESFTLSDAQMKMDLLELDNTLDNEYTQYLMQGKSLPINYTAITHGSQVFTNIRNDVKISRSLTRLKSVFISMVGMTNTPEPEKNLLQTFWHPMKGDSAGAGSGYDFAKELEIQLQLGSKLLPETPIRSLSEAFYQLRKSIGLHFGSEGMALQPIYYSSNGFIAAIDMEKVLGAAFTGTNTMDGQMLTIRTKLANGGVLTTFNEQTYSIFYSLVSDHILSINLTGITVYE